jgi:hypothetical protein
MRICGKCNLAKDCHSFQMLNRAVAYVLTHDPLTGVTLHYKEIYEGLDLVERVEVIYEQIAEDCKHYMEVVI